MESQSEICLSIQHRYSGRWPLDRAVFWHVQPKLQHPLQAPLLCYCMYSVVVSLANSCINNSRGNCKEPQLHAVEVSWPAQQIWNAATGLAIAAMAI